MGKQTRINGFDIFGAPVREEKKGKRKQLKGFNSNTLIQDNKQLQKYFINLEKDQVKEEQENKSLMVYVVRDNKDSDKLVGAYCIHTNIEGFFDLKKRHMLALSRDFMQEIKQRTIFEQRQTELLKT